jgi:hypothetical protein
VSGLAVTILHTLRYTISCFCKIDFFVLLLEHIKIQT